MNCLKAEWAKYVVWSKVIFLVQFKCDMVIEWVRYEDGLEPITQISLQKLSMNGEDEGGSNLQTNLGKIFDQPFNYPTKVQISAGMYFLKSFALLWHSRAVQYGWQLLEINHPDFAAFRHVGIWLSAVGSAVKVLINGNLPLQSSRIPHSQIICFTHVDKRNSIFCIVFKIHLTKDILETKMIFIGPR